MGAGVAARSATLKRISADAIATHSQQRFVANCSEFKTKRIGDISDATPQSRGAMRPRFVKSFAQKIRGRRECRVLAAPAVSCAKVCKGTHTSIQVQTEHSGIPCAMALRLMPCSPRRRIRLVTVADGLKDCLNTVGSTRLRQLDTSNGCQDHTVLPTAASPVVCTVCSLTDQSPPCKHDHAPDAAASTATRP